MKVKIDIEESPSVLLVTAVVAAEATGSMVSASLAMGFIRIIEAHKVAGKPCNIRPLLVSGLQRET
jgi:hypothetical protein